MTGITILIGLLLIALGPSGYFASGGISKTAFIPSLFGIILVLCGVLASRPGLRKHAMHGAVLVALLGAIAAGQRSLPNATAMFNPQEETSRIALGAQLVMTLLCAIYVVLAIRSFITARRKRAETAA